MNGLMKCMSKHEYESRSFYSSQNKLSARRTYQAFIQITLDNWNYVPHTSYYYYSMHVITYQGSEQSFSK